MSPALGGQAFAVRGLHRDVRGPALPLFGEHAALAAGAAVVAVEALLERAIDEEAVRAALAGASARRAGLEVVARHPLIVLDGAHNPAAAEALADALPEAFTWERLHLVLAVFSNKDLKGIVAELVPLADIAYATTTRAFGPPRRRGRGRDRVRGCAVQSFPDRHDGDRRRSRDAGARDLILVTGSLYTVADARRVLLAEASGT